MCLTLPGKIISLKNNLAQVDLGKKIVCAKIIDETIKTGNWVLVYGDLIVRKISKGEADKMKSYLSTVFCCYSDPEAKGKNPGILRPKASG